MGGKFDGTRCGIGVLSGGSVMDGKSYVAFTAIPDKKPTSPPYGTRCT
ncbi:hypothetical protein ACFTUC_09860 [Streptomyces sp. NPDC056944]